MAALAGWILGCAVLGALIIGAGRVARSWATSTTLWWQRAVGIAAVIFILDRAIALVHTLLGAPR